jgi:hypothetical protein
MAITWFGPVDTYILMMLPAGTLLLLNGGSVRDCRYHVAGSVSGCGVKPAREARVAVVCGSPTTFGIATPFDGTTCTTEPRSASPPPAGDVRITEPGDRAAGFRGSTFT